MSGGNASVAVRLGCELHEPTIVEVYRLGNICLPQVGFVGIDWHCITSR
ncbi:hypothetical protein NDA00_20125 [Funiculus sociatus GB2-M2]